MSIRIHPKKNPDPKAQVHLDALKKSMGNVPNIFQTFAHSPAALNFFMAGISALSQCKLPASLREQIALAVAGSNHCDYCASAHTALAKMQHVPAGELMQNLVGKSQDPKVEAALAFARQVVKLRGKLADEDLKAIRSAGYTDEEIVELIAIICHNILTNYFNLIVGTEIDFLPKVSTENVKGP